MENEEVNKRAKALINHFGLNLNEIILPIPDEYDDEFTIKFYNGEFPPIQVEVLPFKSVMQNLLDIYGISSVLYEYENTVNQIEYYTKLRDSNYYFRYL